MSSVSELKNKSLSGVKAVGSVGLLTKGIGFLGGIFLARWLAPEDFGIFAIVGFILGFFKVFGDFGLGASIIQNEKETDEETLSSIFYFQQAVAVLLISILILLLPWIESVYPAFKIDYKYLVYALALVFLFDSLKSIPKSALSRGIEFKKISQIELIENLTYWVVALSAAYMQQGVWALAMAVLLRTIIGTILFYWSFNWWPRRVFSWSKIKTHMGFGIDYQLARVVDFIRISVNPTVISYFFGVKAVGLVSWASTTSMIVQFIVLSVDRVSFSLYSRLQNNSVELVSSVKEAMRYSVYIIFPLMAGLVLYSEEIIGLVYTTKWLEAEGTLHFYCLNMALIAMFYPLSTCILALGHARYFFIQGAILTIVEFGSTILMREQFGIQSIAMGQTISVVLQGIAMTIFLFRKHGIFINFFGLLFKATFIVGVVTTAFYYLSRYFKVEELWQLILVVLAYGFVYLGLLFIFEREVLKKALSFFKR